MKLRAIIPNESSNASSWWRVTQPFSMLSKGKHDAKWYNMDDLVSIDVRDAIVIIHRVIPGNPKNYIQKLRNAGAKQIIFSIDDTTIHKEAFREYLVSSGGLTTAAIDRIISNIDKTIETINLCDGLLVSTDNLADLAIEIVEVPIYVIPNAIDETWYVDHLSVSPEYIGNSDKVYIGYASGRRPEADLELMAKAWHTIDQEYENVRFVVAGWQPDIIDRNINLDKKIRIPYVPLEDWPKSMQVDIGCCPLTHTTFNRGKSLIKFDEYTLAGACVVASSHYIARIYRQCTGLLATTEDEWYFNLKKLIDNPGMRRTLQESAYYELHNYNSLEALIEEWNYTLGVINEDSGVVAKI